MPVKKSEMMGTILQQLQAQFPEIFPETAPNNRYEIYSVLHHFGTYCSRHPNDNKTREILSTINKVYQRKNLFTCNAIENEFFPALAAQWDANAWVKHLPNIPETLWAAYLKVFIETQKNEHQ